MSEKFESEGKGRVEMSKLGHKLYMCQTFFDQHPLNCGKLSMDWFPVRSNSNQRTMEKHWDFRHPRHKLIVADAVRWVEQNWREMPLALREGVSGRWLRDEIAGYHKINKGYSDLIFLRL